MFSRYGALSRRALLGGALASFPAASGRPRALPKFDAEKAGQNWSRDLEVLELTMAHASGVIGLVLDSAEQGCPGLKDWLAAWQDRPAAEMLAALRTASPELYAPIAGISKLSPQ
jgi:hypothetical protein